MSKTELQEAVRSYNGTVTSDDCRVNSDGSKTCKVVFPSQNLADEAIKAAKSHQMNGVNGAAAEQSTPATQPDDGGSNTVIVGVVVGVLVAVGLVAAFVVYRIRRSKDAIYGDDENYTNMNMALEDMNEVDI